jgi:hypothetical protein
MERTGFWRMLGVFVCLSTLSLFGLILLFKYDPHSSGKAVLSTLARAQTGIFAIVFSVVVLGVQLSTSQYAPRLATDFTTDPFYQRTVGIFGASIGLNIVGLFLFDHLPTAVLAFLLVLSLTVATGAFVTLYRFVRETLEKTTPEGILAHLKDRMTPETMLAEIKDAAEDTVNPDPFLALISVIHSFIDDKDRASASLGLDILAGRVAALLRSPATPYITQDSPADQSLERVCVDQLPNIVDEAADNGLTQIGLDVSDTVETIGETAIAVRSERAFEHLLTGYIDLVDTLGFEPEDERIRTKILDTTSDLLKSGAKSGLWESTAIATRRLGWVAAASLMKRDLDDGRNRRYGSLLILCFPKLLATAVDSYATFQDHSVQGWLRLQRSDSHSVARLINSCYGSMAELTSAAIRYELRTEQQVVDWSSVAYGWSEGAKTLDNTHLDSMAQLWFGTLLYLEYLAAMSPDHVMQGFNPHGRHRVSQELGRTTVTRIENGDLDPTAVIEFRPGGVDPIEMPLTGHKVPIISDPDVSFSDWIANQPFLFAQRESMGSFTGTE